MGLPEIHQELELFLENKYSSFKVLKTLILILALLLC